MHMRRFITLTFLSILMGSGLSFAATANVEPPYTRTGTIDYLDFGHNEIVINDTVYEIAPYVIVHGTNKHVILRRDSLQKGMSVGFNVIQRNGHTGYLKEIWLLKGQARHTNE